MPAIGRATVGVMGASGHDWPELAEPLGRLLAELELNLLTGAGAGIMTSVSRAFVESRRGAGVSIGIVPCESEQVRHRPRSGSPNPWIDLPIYTHLPLSGVDGQDLLSRNHINILSSDVVIALPGSDGTASEVELALEYQKPVAVFVTEAGAAANLNAAAARLTTIADVETFIRGQIE